jgi:hypothetical protein
MRFLLAVIFVFCSLSFFDLIVRIDVVIHVVGILCIRYSAFLRVCYMCLSN